MNTKKNIAYIIKFFEFKSLFVVKKYNEKNNKAYEKIIKCLLFNEFYKGSPKVSDDLKKFVYNSLFKRESLTVLDNEKDITDFIIAYNRFIGYIEFKRAYESHKFNYISVQGARDNKFLFLSIKSDIIDKNKTYVIVNTKLYDSVINDYDLTESFKDYKLDVFNNSLIRDKKLRPYENKTLSLESLIDVFYSYKKAIKINNEIYSLKKNEFDYESFYRFLVSDFFNYYSVIGSLKEFYSYLTENKGLKLDLTLNEWFNLKTETSNYDYISLIYYLQLIRFIESNKALYKDTFTFYEYKKFLKFIIELKDKNIRFEKNLILFILENKTHILFKNRYREFIESL